MLTLPRSSRARRRFLLPLVATCALVPPAPVALAQDAPPLTPEEAAAVDRPIVEIRFEGLERVPRQAVENVIRAAVGEPFLPEVIRADVANLYRLGDFERIDATYTITSDGGVAVTYRFVEQPIVTAVQVVGNRLVADEELLSIIPLAPGLPRDEYLVQRARRAIRELYRERGHYLVEVEVDEQELAETGILLFRVIEGPRVKVREIDFRGNDAFQDEQLASQVDTEEAFFLLRPGRLDEEGLAEDVASLTRFYHERGYLDARVDREIELSPDSREARVVFLIREGPQYVLRDLEIAGGTLFSPQQLAARLEIKEGDVYRQDLIRRSLEVLRADYGDLGYFDTTIDVREIRLPDEPAVNLLISIQEGAPSLVGRIEVIGNTITRQGVILRDVSLRPNRPLSTVELDRSLQRLEETRLFNDVTITVQDPDPVEPVYRDVLVEIDERNTGAFTFGVAVGSDSGLFGDISLRQNNFDISDWPESLEEFLRGRAFRGAGQQFSMNIQPGTEISQYAFNFANPYVFNSPTTFRFGGLIRERIYRIYDEDRMGLSVGLGREIGDVWSVAVNTRLDRVELDDIDADAPTEIFESQGPDTLTGLALSLTRNTLDDRLRPSRGSITQLTAEQVGLFGGDRTFTKLGAEHTLFLTLDEDFLGRPTVLRFDSQVGYILDGAEAPVYEQFYLGGRAFRGFEFRTISPKGIRADTGEPSDEPVGGTWMVFFSTEYQFPLYGENISGVVFADVGTVTDEVALTPLRMGVGAGLRISVPQLSPVPIALDFAFPVLKEEDDEEQYFSFAAEFPF